MTTLIWNAPGYSQLVIRVGSPTGPAMTGTLPFAGATNTGDWVTDGMQFFLVDLATGNSVANVTVRVIVRRHSSSIRPTCNYRQRESALQLY
jgi:hypothetical protein